MLSKALRLISSLLNKSFVGGSAAFITLVFNKRGGGAYVFKAHSLVLAFFDPW